MKIIVFGAGKAGREFIHEQGKRYDIIFIVDNDWRKWGTDIEGIKIKCPKVLNNNGNKEIKVVIAMNNYHSVVNQLEEIGHKDYDIYTLKNRNNAYNLEKQAEELFESISDKLYDEESLNLLKLKINSWYRDRFCLIKHISKEPRKWELIECDYFFDQLSPGQELIIYGTPQEAFNSYAILNSYGIIPDAYCLINKDKDLESFFYDKNIISADDIIKRKEAFVIIASADSAYKIHYMLLIELFPRKNIFLPMNGTLYAHCGWQYFDCPQIKPMENEVFFDGGCYEGESSKDFVEWCGGNYEKIIAFEPDEESYKIIKDNIKLRDFTVYHYASGSESKTAYFYCEIDRSGRRLSQNGSKSVRVETIDNIFKGERCTFIKLDIEGAELDTLIGAEHTIRKYKPRMAISIYHKPTDVIDIIPYLNSIRSDYKYCVRHYTSCNFETVLYAY